MAHVQSHPRRPGRASGQARRLLAQEGRARADIRLTVCPYMHPLDADITGRYADAGVDAVAALLFAFTADDVRSTLDSLQPVFDRAAAS